MSTSITKEKIDSIKDRCDSATSGPWIPSIEGRDHPLGGENVILRGVNRSEIDLYLIGGTVADYIFVAHARQDIPLLIAEIERLQKEIQALK
jgi:hypothetical protein